MRDSHYSALSTSTDFGLQKAGKSAFEVALVLVPTPIRPGQGAQELVPEWMPHRHVLCFAGMTS
jgi:hypothetical protein